MSLSLSLQAVVCRAVKPCAAARSPPTHTTVRFSRRQVALRPPVSVDAVAGACASAAMNELAGDAATRRAVGTLDGTAAINAESLTIEQA